jgi:hypothetical protein
LSKEAKTSSVLFEGVDVGTGPVGVAGTSVDVAVGASVAGSAVAVGGGGVSLGARVCGVVVGRDVGSGAHAPTAVATTQRTSKLLIGLTLFMADDLLPCFDRLGLASIAQSGPIGYN